MPKAPPTYKRITSAPARRRDDRTREERGDKFYKGARWMKLRRLFLARNPLCEDCTANGRTVSARHVHHRQRRRDHPELAYVMDNLQGLCHPCHSKHTAAEQRGDA